MQPEQIEWLRGWANAHGCKLDIDGEIGFGRRCVGLIMSDSTPFSQYLSYGWYGMEGDEAKNREVNHIVAAARPADAYHKDDMVAVLGEGFEALEQLYEWVKTIDEAGLTTELVFEADFRPGTSTMTLLMTGRRGQVRRLCYDNSKAD